MKNMNMWFWCCFYIPQFSFYFCLLFGVCTQNERISRTNRTDWVFKSRNERRIYRNRFKSCLSLPLPPPPLTHITFLPRTSWGVGNYYRTNNFWSCNIFSVGFILFPLSTLSLCESFTTRVIFWILFLLFWPIHSSIRAKLALFMLLSRVSNGQAHTTHIYIKVKESSGKKSSSNGASRRMKLWTIHNHTRTERIWELSNIYSYEIPCNMSVEHDRR